MDSARTMAPVDVMMQRSPLAERHPDHAMLRRLGCLSNRLGDFTCLTVAEADATLLVPDHNERGESEAPAALNNLGDTVDVDQLIDELAIAVVTVPASASVSLSCHIACSSNRLAQPSKTALKTQSALSSAIGKCLYTAVVKIGTAVEHYILYAGFCRPRGDQLSNSRPCVPIGAGLPGSPDFGLQGRSGRECSADDIVNDLSVNVL